MSEYDVVMDGGKPWGIRLQGGKDSGIPLQIAQVTPDSKASLKGLLVGTQILAINDNKTEPLTMIHAQNLIKVTGDRLNLRLKKDSQGASPQVKYIVMEGGKPWGIRLQGGKDSGIKLKVAQVTPGSKASQMGLLVGYEIISINDDNTEDLTMIDAQNLIKEAGDRLKLGIKHDRGAVKRGGSVSLATQPNTTDESDESFFDDLKKSMGGGEEDWSSREAKGNTFKSLQEHTKAGQGRKVLTVFDVPAGERHKCIPTLAPKVEKGNERDDPHGDTGSFRSSNSNQSREVIMDGGKPWGIRLQGGKNSGSPLNIAQVTPGSKASQNGLLLGDQIISINNYDSKDLTMMDAQNLIKETGDKLKLCIKDIDGTSKGVVKRVDDEIDEAFFEDLKISMKGYKDDRSGRDVKGNAFKMLQDVVDSGTI